VCANHTRFNQTGSSEIIRRGIQILENKKSGFLSVASKPMTTKASTSNNYNNELVPPLTEANDELQNDLTDWHSKFQTRS
jgi:hypothetical protein